LVEEQTEEQMAVLKVVGRTEVADYLVAHLVGIQTVVLKQGRTGVPTE
jgi:hypothetical protein